MNRTLEATVHRYHCDRHQQLRRHLDDFVNANNFGHRLKTNKVLTPYEFICAIWTSQPERFNLNPLQQMPGLKPRTKEKYYAALATSPRTTLRNILFSPSGSRGDDAYACRDTSDVRNGKAVLLKYAVRHKLHDRIEQRWLRIPHAEEEQGGNNWEVAPLEGGLLLHLGQEPGELLQDGKGYRAIQSARPVRLDCGLLDHQVEDARDNASGPFAMAALH
jgi:putative transposase